MEMRQTPSVNRISKARGSKADACSNNNIVEFSVGKTDLHSYFALRDPRYLVKSVRPIFQESGSIWCTVKILENFAEGN